MPDNDQNPFQAPAFVEERTRSAIPPRPDEPSRNRVGEAGVCLAGYGLLFFGMSFVTDGNVLMAWGTVPGLLLSLGGLARAPRLFAWTGVALGCLGPAYLLARLV